MKILKRIKLLPVSVILCLSICVLSVQSVYAKIEPRDFRLEEENCPRGSLSDVEESVYIDLFTSLHTYNIDGEKEIKVTYTAPYSYFANFTRDRLVDLMFEVLYDNPTYYWVNMDKVGASVKKDKTTDSATISWKYYTLYTASEIEAIDNKIEAVMNKVKAQTDKLRTTEEKVRYIHDYLCDNCDYDYDAVEDPDNEKKLPAWTAVGALLNGKAVCLGYTHAFNLLCINSGITSVSYQYCEYEDSAHIFNLVKLDNDKWYGVDCTWDGQDSKTYTDYYLMGQNTIDREYSDSKLITPSVTISTADYFNNRSRNDRDDRQHERLDGGLGRSFEFDEGPDRYFEFNRYFQFDEEAGRYHEFDGPR